MWPRAIRQLFEHAPLGICIATAAGESSRAIPRLHVCSGSNPWRRRPPSTWRRSMPMPLAANSFSESYDTTAGSSTIARRSVARTGVCASSSAPSLASIQVAR